MQLKYQHYIELIQANTICQCIADSARDNSKHTTTRPYITSSSSCNTPRTSTYAKVVQSQEEIDYQQLQAHFTTHYNKLLTIEQNKHLPPNFSYAFKDIASYYKLTDHSFINDSGLSVLPLLESNTAQLTS